MAGRLRRNRDRTVLMRRAFAPGSAALCCGLLGSFIIDREPVRELPPSSLAVFHEGHWTPWWRSDSAPTRWQGEENPISRAIEWRKLQPGVELARLHLAGTGEAWRVGVVLVRLDPARVTFSLVNRPKGAGGDTRWTIADAPSNAAVAFNAGQFADAVPWGWVVRSHRERRPPGRGPLAPAVIFTTTGAVAIVPADSIAIVRRDSGIRNAFQSYPTLLERDGEIPRALHDSGRGLDVSHRDSRLAFGMLRGGRVLIALTRFEALGGALALLPFGLTTPEMAALMGAAGARQAVMLDGGISGQLLVRDSLGATTSWSGLRRVPLGLVVTPTRLK